MIQPQLQRPKREREEVEIAPPGLLAGATTRQDVVKLVITINRSSSESRGSKAIIVFLSSRRSRRHQPRLDRARTSPHVPPEDSPSRARETHAPPPGIVSAAFSPPSSAAAPRRQKSSPPLPPANFPVSRRRRRRLPTPVTRRRLANSAEATR
ncbi:hypothetical protein DY000_02042275 [Brassica cretica]|uniref:Uncharacterized protein n=1 Tax=Brassica cretica TaxID=69181 RepID=A0ABQ7BFF0_BRACR|nr:hypothetical protein DY000_02042275 [Brassica cretica]